jgi:hypothetical protein
VIGFAIRSYFRGRTELLPIIGILFTGLGEWENGGFYALAPLIWMLAGIVAAASWPLVTAPEALGSAAVAPAD